jgi:hypothetical protein
VIPEVEGMPLPSAACQVAEPSLPEPRTGQLTVDEEERPPPRATLGQPRLDVEAALLELDLVLADRTPGTIPADGGGTASGLHVAGPWVVAVQGVVEHLVPYHSSGLITKPLSGLG